MRERLAAAGTGLSTVFVGEKSLHSRYDPAGEGEKYIRALNFTEGESGKPGEKIQFLILIEPGLGYIIPALRRVFPLAKIIALHVSDFFTRFPCESGENTVRWSPGSGLSCTEFLEQEIPDIGIRAVKIVEWRPALAAYGAAYRDLLETAVTFLRRIDANARTVSGFGRRWVRNFFRNISTLRVFFSILPGSGPWIITGAGPGLEGVLPLIADMQQKGATVLAASSSVPALAAGGIAPDLVIGTDGGGWAKFHLWEAWRCALGRAKGGPFFLAASLTAALPCQYSDFPVLPLSDGSRWQEAALKALGVPRLVFPQRGTVAASALDLALCCTTGGVFLAGLDLSNEDIKTHARPYALDRFYEDGATRLTPRYSQAFDRAGQLSASGSRRVYAEWFGGQLRAYPGRIRSLGKNNPVFDALPSGDAPESYEGTQGMGRARIKTRVFRRAPDISGETVRVLTGLLDASGPALAIRRELASLLFPGGEEPPLEQLIREINGLAARRGGRTRDE
ncbi:MAG: DUF115 domain-containing protein [Spirochaetaceae bacterium]|jgi:hypothetical protein|nr:DUF115 domain-containing protein [Spirochaetaceae bacterium]